MVLVAMLLRRANLRRLVYAGMVVVVLLRGPLRPGAAGPARRDRRDRGPGSSAPAWCCSASRSTARSPAATPRRVEPLAPGGRPSDRRLAVILNPVKVEDVGQFEAIVAAMADRGRLVDAELAPDDRGGLREPARATEAVCRRRRPGPSCVAATGRSGRSARSSRGPAYPSARSRPPAPATCSPATSTSPSTCAPRSTWRLTGQDRAIDMVSVKGRRPRGLALHGDGRHGLRRRADGGRQRGPQKGKVGWLASAAFAVGIDAVGARGNIQGHCGASIGPIDGQVAGSLAFNGEPGNQPERRL